MILNIWVWVVEEKEGICVINIAYLLCAYFWFLIVVIINIISFVDDLVGFHDRLCVWIN
jgi:hypothetical protein